MGNVLGEILLFHLRTELVKGPNEWEESENLAVRLF